MRALEGSLPSASQQQQPQRRRPRFQWLLALFMIMALTQVFGMTPVLYHKLLQYLSYLSTTASLEGDLQTLLLLQDKNKSLAKWNGTTDETMLMENMTTAMPMIDNDIHYQSLAILDLLDWEVQSVKGIQHRDAKYKDGIGSCRPPNGILQKCCLGCFSMGGDINVGKRKSCSGKPVQAYNAIRDHAQQLLDSSSHLLKHEHHVACDICRIIEISRKHNLTIGIFGDSMTTQVVQGMICEMQRRNYNVTVDHQVSSGYDCMECIKSITHLYIRSPLWKEDDPSVYMKFMFQYRYPFSNSTEEHYVATTSDVLVINFGLHWGYIRKHKYQQVMDSFLKYLKDHGTFQLLAHRETSAQHFDADGGDFALRIGNFSTLCVPMTWNGTTAGWREREVQSSARKLGYTVITADDTMAPIDSNSTNRSFRDELVILPFFNFTAAHHSMHPMTNAERTVEDCSHYCGSPFIYQPLWRSLRLAMDRRFESA